MDETEDNAIFERSNKEATFESRNEDTLIVISDDVDKRCLREMNTDLEKLIWEKIEIYDISLS